MICDSCRLYVDGECWPEKTLMGDECESYVDVNKEEEIMNNLVMVEKINEVLVTNSRNLAEVLGKQHKNIIRDLENILTSSDLSSLIIPSNYKDKKGELRKQYLLTKDGLILYMFNIQGYNKEKLAYINRFNEMERQLVLGNSYQIEDPIKRAERWIEEEKERQQLKLTVKEQAPKVEYHDNVLTSPNVFTTSQIAKSLGIKSAVKLNQILKDLKIQYKQQGQWLLCSKYAEEGYTKDITFFQSVMEKGKGEDAGAVSRTRHSTKWTEKGKEFIYNQLKKAGYIND